jgi:DNA-3-methyladenine glycosylase
MKLKKQFFARGAEEVARDLLGKVLVRKFEDGSIVRAIITETEAYIGEHDLASHARFGRTKRTEAMYAQAGTIYMFFTYGVHWMLNIVTSKKDDPQAVLIRGARELGKSDGSENQDVRRLDGPGKLTKYLELDGSFYGEDITKSKRLWVEKDSSLPLRMTKYTVTVTPRIGIGYAKEWVDKPLRFVLKIKDI